MSVHFFNEVNLVFLQQFPLLLLMNQKNNGSRINSRMRISSKIELKQQWNRGTISCKMEV